ncbi:MAG: prepilin peptidase, partial [Eubacterium sp.]
GILLGTITIPLSKRLTLSRTDDPVKAVPLDKAVFKAGAIIIGVVSSVAVMLTAETIELAVRNLLLLIPIFSISCVDALVRKIPNPLLLAIVIIQIVYAVYYCVTTKDSKIFLTMIFGFFCGMIVCTIPSILKIPMGAGDIKYSGAIGLTLYAFGYIQSMVFMAVFVLIFYIYMKIKKKGGMKTQIPMGPFLSIGTVISMCFSIFDLIG